MNAEIMICVVAVKVGGVEVANPAVKISSQGISRDSGVPGTNERRFKRLATSSGVTKNSLTQADRVQFLSAHNTMRRWVTSSTDMLKMVSILFCLQRLYSVIY